MTFRAFVLVLLIAVPAFAEFRHVSIDYKGEECASCADSMNRILGKLRGVTSVAVDQTKSTITVELAPENRVPLGEIRDAIKRVGFTPGEARVVVRGAIAQEGDARVLKPHGLAEVYELSGSETTPAAAALIEGTVPPPTPGARGTLIAKTARIE